MELELDSAVESILNSGGIDEDGGVESGDSATFVDFPDELFEGDETFLTGATDGDVRLVTPPANHFLADAESLLLTPKLGDLIDPEDPADGGAGTALGGGLSEEAFGDAELVSLENAVLAELVDRAIWSAAFDVHRRAKKGLLFLYDRSERDMSDLRQVSEPNKDVFGNTIVGAGTRSLKINQWECVCPECGLAKSALRFASHLEKCMGMGRNSSRIANRRLAASCSTPSFPSTSTRSRTNSEEEEPRALEEEDEDWLSSRKRNYRRKVKNRLPRNRKAVASIRKHASGSSLTSVSDEGSGGGGPLTVSRKTSSTALDRHRRDGDKPSSSLETYDIRSRRRRDSQSLKPKSSTGSEDPVGGDIHRGHVTTRHGHKNGAEAF